ncbi:MAG: hypothetical protein IIB30_08565 [Chloroflexi bacterium]|nr:hypothetical protein [Chloroflexota bacterium]
MTWFRFKACVRCLGDLVWDDGDWLCLQCGRYYYTRLHQPEAIPDWQWDQGSEPRKEKANALSPVSLHSYQLVQSKPVAFNPLGSRTLSTQVEGRTLGIDVSRSPATQRKESPI